MRVKLFPMLVVCLAFVLSVNAQQLVESSTTAVIINGLPVIRAQIDNPGAAKDVFLRLELLDTAGSVRTVVTTSLNVRPGRHSYEIVMPSNNLDLATGDDIAWYRLRYVLGNSAGILSMSQIMPDLFELRIIASDQIVAGMNYRVRVRATNPFNGRPAAGVQIESSVELEIESDTDSEDQLKLNAKGITDESGFAVLDLPIPVGARLDGDGEIRVVGRKNGIVRESEEDLSALSEDVQFLMMADKPIYQPEQTINIRGILMKGGESRTILAGAEIEFRIKDEDETLLFREKVMSSGFGIASTAWQIPSNANLGTYRIEVRDEDGDEIGGQRVRISRYDLPNFVVEAKASKTYYLPNEKEAEVSVSADYLFGKPVTKGKVRVVEETEREWNYKEQKYDINEGQVREGLTDKDGTFTGRFDLTEAHGGIEDSDYEKYRDLHFAAYYTDLTTNKTEQRRFDIRVSREPIHVYVIADTSDLNPTLPVDGYVSAFYADGTPAECDIEIRASEDDKERYRTVSRAKTNHTGAGRLSMPRPDIGDPDDYLDLELIARDAKGQKGTAVVEDVDFDLDQSVIQIKTDKAIYKPGDVMKVSILSTKRSGTVYVDVVSGWSVLDSSFAELKNSRAEVRVPYRESFKGELKVAAFIEEGEDLVETSRGVIFPARQSLGLTAEFDKAVYKPNEEATVKFGIADAVGNAVEAALGIVVLDKAVEVRARTDDEFGGIWRDFSGLLGYGANFGSVNVKDLNELDLTRPISDEMQLIAEVMLFNNYYSPNVFRSKSYFDEARSVFGTTITKQFSPVLNALDSAFKTRDHLHPVNDQSLRGILDLYDITFDDLTDPWGTHYRPEFSVEGARNIVKIMSAGPDKQFDSRDDFLALTAGFEYFTPFGRAIDAAVKNYHVRTGSFIRDEKMLLEELGVRALTDRFGRGYRIIFEVDRRDLVARVRSAGPDGRFENGDRGGDDFDVWKSRIDLFATIEKRMTDIQRTVKKPAANETEFRATLAKGGIDVSSLRDGNGNPLYITVQDTSRYWDKATIETVQNHVDSKRVERTVVIPVVQQIRIFTIRSNGNDKKQGTWDDITLVQFVHILAERTKDDPKPISAIQPISYSRSTGAIAGVVTDANGAAITGATVSATDDATGVERSVTSSDSGRYLIASLAAGTYTLKVEANGFMRNVIGGVRVDSGRTTQADVVLNVGGVSAVVSVVSVSSELNATNASVSTVINGARILALPLNSKNLMNLVALQPGTANAGEQEKSTPRLREYFPETLLWRPEVVTDAGGKAEVKFRMADNITTWKMYTIASTKTGKVGVAEKEITAFQAFFVDLDPPKFLTAGDEIFLPTQVRNYTDTKQKVTVTIAVADWFTLLTDPLRQMNVESGGSENAVFGFKASTPVKDGKQRVTAIGETDSDAIERPVTVRPDGREVVRTDSRYITGSGTFTVNFPANALPANRAAELKIYPNLMAHVAESVEGMLSRPYGCGEQTVSSTYPNVMILKFAGGGEGKTRRISEATERKARKYLQRGYERLLGYQLADGGFSYWGGKDTADTALTAYALRFLNDASEFAAVDPDVVRRAEDWLLKQQRTDGSWNTKYRYEEVENEKRAKMLTTYVTRTLALLTSLRRNSERKETADAVKKAVSYLRSRNAEIDDPYSLALYGLAASDAGDKDTANSVAEKLNSAAKTEDGSIYWNLESNTAFNGWGTAGRIETTALVAQLLMRTDNERFQDSIGRAMVFLLKNKDRYGVWYSTQTTINVLDAFVAAMNRDGAGGSQTVEVLVNGTSIQTIEIAPDRLDRIVVPLTGTLKIGENSVDLRSSARSPVMAQTVTTHYIDWRDADSSGRTVDGSRALNLDYRCDRTEAQIMQEIACSVAVERVGFRGYGMLLAEIGTPPGADVSRESLDAAMENDWSLSKYEVLPDRIVLYMWAKAGGTRFNFKFRPRYGVNAQSAPSVVYDYYNPEAQATVAPIRFTVR